MPGSNGTEEGPPNVPLLEPWNWFTLFEGNLKHTNLNQKAFSCIMKDGASHSMKSQVLLIWLKTSAFCCRRIRQIQTQVSVTLIYLRKSWEGGIRSGAEKVFVAADTESADTRLLLSPGWFLLTAHLEPSSAGLLHVDTLILNRRNATANHFREELSDASELPSISGWEGQKQGNFLEAVGSGLAFSQSLAVLEKLHAGSCGDTNAQSICCEQLLVQSDFKAIFSSCS